MAKCKGVQLFLPFKFRSNCSFPCSFNFLLLDIIHSKHCLLALFTARWIGAQLSASYKLTGAPFSRRKSPIRVQRAICLVNELNKIWKTPLPWSSVESTFIPKFTNFLTNSGFLVRMALKRYK